MILCYNKCVGQRGDCPTIAATLTSRPFFIGWRKALVNIKIHKEGDVTQGYECEVSTTPANNIQLYVAYWGQFYTDTFGDSDLEFYVTVKNDSLPALCCQLIAERFKDEQAFGQWLDAKAIPHEDIVY
jgi:hypothetical protein